MTKLIGILRVYADTPRVAKIVGKSKASGLKEFKYTGDDLGKRSLPSFTKWLTPSRNRSAVAFNACARSLESRTNQKPETVHQHRSDGTD
jgi:hypothetical protein